MEPVDLYLDTETFCETPIRDGTHRYAEDAEVMVLAWALDDPLFGEGEIVVEDLTDDEGRGCFEQRSEEFDIALYTTLESGGKIIVHNSGFDRTVMRHNALPIDADRIHDTMVQAMAHGLPGGLDKLSAIFKLEDDAKHAGGRDLIRMFCMPQPKRSKIRRRTKLTDPEEWQRFLRYAGGDIRSMRALRRKLPTWNYPGKPGNELTEYDTWVLDQRVNDRGFKVDLELARAAIECFDRVKDNADAFVQEATDGEVQSANQRDALLARLLSHYGVSLPDLQKGTIERRLDDENIPEAAKELLRARLDTAVASVAKYKALERSVSRDGRLRGTIQFCGAVRTGRDAGRIFQPQNLVRPNKAESKAVEEWIETIKGGAADLMLDNPGRAMAVALRGAIIAEEGKKLVIADLSNIEGRVLAWLAGEEWKLQAFRDFDAGVGHDLYKIGAARILRKRPEDVTEDERQILGKVPELACLESQTRVLTLRGPVAIVDVELSDKLWDGEEWVAHKGLVDRGTKAVISIDGVEMTADHEVLAGETWQEARTVACSPNTRRYALETGLASLWSLASTLAREAACAVSWSDVLADASRTKSMSAACVEARALAATTALRKRLGYGAKTGSGTQRFAPMTPTEGVSAIASRRASTAATTQTTKASPTTVGGASLYTRLGAKTAQRFSLIWSRCRAGMILLWSWTGRTTTGGTNPGTCASSVREPTATTSDASANCNKGSPNLKRVYDIANAGPRNRFTILTDTGALVVHNCGFQGAAGAFGTMAALYGLDLEASRIEEIVYDWRDQNSAIKQFWWDMDRAAREATLHPNRTVYCGKISFNRWREWLRMQLPSGRVLCYTQPAIVPHAKFEGSDSLSYLGVNSYTRKWERIQTYGGKLVENAVQATARDVLKTNSHAIEAAGYEIILPVHDETVTEVPDTDRFTTDELCAILAQTPWWCDEKLPLAAGGFETYRYRKD